MFTLAAAGTAYALVAAGFVRRFRRDLNRAGDALLGVSDGPASPPGVVMLKPLHGAEPGLGQNLESFFCEAEASKARLVFGLQDPHDPARAVVEGLMAAHPGAAARLVVDTATRGANRKIANLINLSRGAEEPTVVISDSDICAPQGYLLRLGAALAKPRVGIVTCPYVGRGAGGPFARLAAMGLSYHFLPNVLTGVGLGLATPCMGSTIALRRETLEAIGGFEAFADVLADDYAMGAAVRAQGERSVLAPVLVVHTCAENSLAAVFAHETRWAVTVKGVDPLGHAGSVLTHPFALSLISLLLLAGRTEALLLVASALAARAAVKGAVDRIAGEASGSFPMLPVRDIVSFLVFAASFFVRSVEWRGESFHVTKSGDLRPV